MDKHISVTEEFEPLTGDPELIEIFLEEAKELLERLDIAVQDWLHNPQDETLLRLIKRPLHTIKSGARLAGIFAIGTLSHVLETLLDDLTFNLIQHNPGILKLTQKTVDCIAEQINQVKNGGPVTKALILLNEIENTHAKLSDQIKQLRITQPEIAPITPASVATDSVANPTDTVIKPTITYRSPEQQIQVLEELLNDMAASVYTISIDRPRLDQQNANLKSNLEQLNTTVALLHEQLQQIPIATATELPITTTLIATAKELSNISVALTEQHTTVETSLLQQTHIFDDLQYKLFCALARPFTQIVYRFSSIVRCTADMLGKKVKLIVVGSEIEMNYNMLNRITAPIEHILRNIVAHSIERSEQRQAIGKNPTAKITMNLAKADNEVLITIADDGNGLNLPEIRKRAIERDLLKPDMDDNDIMQLIFEPKFIVQDKVTCLSCQPPFYDILKEIKTLGGNIKVSSEAGCGITFVLSVPANPYMPYIPSFV